MNISQAKKIMGKNFIGPVELNNIKVNLDIAEIKTEEVPEIIFSTETLEGYKNDHILILGVDKNKNGQVLTLDQMRSFFGLDSKKAEPCFYNQDWYLKEDFFRKKTLDFRWYLIKKEVKPETRGKDPGVIRSRLESHEDFPMAILTAYTFFAYYFHTDGELLWKYDFIWCSDEDNNGDRIYTGRYKDTKKINKNGFNIHRHLSIRPCYGAITQII